MKMPLKVALTALMLALVLLPYVDAWRQTRKETAP